MIQRIRNLLYRWECFRLYRKNQRAFRKQFAARTKIKGRILTVGVCRCLPGMVELYECHSWEICIANGALGYRVDETGRVWHCGYTVQELCQIAHRKEEWAEVPMV